MPNKDHIYLQDIEDRNDELYEMRRRIAEKEYALSKDINDALFDLAASLHKLSPENTGSIIEIRTNPGIVNALWKYHTGEKSSSDTILIRFPGINAAIKIW